MNFDDLKEFNVELIKSETSFYKIRIDKKMLLDLLKYLKNNAEFDFDRLNTIIAVDLGCSSDNDKKKSIEANGEQFELIYDLHSTNSAKSLRVSVLIDRNSPRVPSVVEIFKSAYFDECEIYDLFGIIFENNPDLKRLLMPKGWIGYPLRKDYKLTDERLAWNEVK